MDRTIEIRVSFDTKKKQVIIKSYEPESGEVTDLGTYSSCTNQFSLEYEDILYKVGDDVASWIGVWVDELNGTYIEEE